MASIFKGLRVVDFSNVLAGPHPTAFLADFGAEVIKIEKPKTGDEIRSYLPKIDGMGVPFFWLNRGKKSVVLELDDPEGREIAEKLAASADIIVENFRPGVMKKFSLDYANIKKINPKVIYCSISAYGQEGAFSKKPGYDVLAQALSGAMDMTGDPNGEPTRVGFVLGDFTAGVYAYGAIATALYHRERTGKGQYMDISLIDCLVSYNHYVEGVSVGAKPTRSGNNAPGAAPFGLFKGKENRFVVICAINPKHWGLLCNAMKRPEMIDDPEFNSVGARVKNVKKVTEIIEGWLCSYENIDIPAKILDEAGVPCSKVNSTSDLVTDEYMLSRGMIVDFPMPEGMSVKSIKARGTPFRFSEDEAVFGVSPKLGQHEDEVLKSIGYSSSAIADLKKKWEIA